MTTIWKFNLSLTDVQNISMPIGAEILTVQMQHNEITLWAIVQPENSNHSRTFEIVGTGNPMDVPQGNRKYIGTVQDRGFVWHVFEITRTIKAT